MQDSNKYDKADYRTVPKQQKPLTKGLFSLRQSSAKCLLVVKIGTIKRLDDVFFKLLFADGMGISVSCILDFEITEQNG